MISDELGEGSTGRIAINCGRGGEYTCMKISSPPMSLQQDVEVVAQIDSLWRLVMSRTRGNLGKDNFIWVMSAMTDIRIRLLALLWALVSPSGCPVGYQKFTDTLWVWLSADPCLTKHIVITQLTESNCRLANSPQKSDYFTIPQIATGGSIRSCNQLCFQPLFKSFPTAALLNPLKGFAVPDENIVIEPPVAADESQEAISSSKKQRSQPTKSRQIVTAGRRKQQKQHESVPVSLARRKLVSFSGSSMVSLQGTVPHHPPSARKDAKATSSAIRRIGLEHQQLIGSLRHFNNWSNEGYQDIIAASCEPEPKIPPSAASKQPEPDMPANLLRERARRLILKLSHTCVSVPPDSLLLDFNPPRRHPSAVLRSELEELSCRKST